MAELPRLRVGLTLDSATFVKETRRVNDSVRGLGRSIEQQTGLMTRGFNAAGAAVKSLAVGLVAGLGAASIGQLARLGKEALDTAGNLGELAAQAGVATGELQALQLAGLQVGISQEQLVTSLAQFGRRVGEAAQGTGDLADTMVRYGIAARDSSGNIRGSVDVLSDFADAVEGARSTQEQLTIVSDAFGSRIGARLLPLLNEGAEGFRNWMETAEAAGLVLSPELVARADAASDAMATLQFAISKGFQIGIVKAFNAEINATVDNLTAARQAGEFFGRIVGNAMNAATESLRSLQPFLETTAREFRALGNLLEQFFKLTGIPFAFADDLKETDAAIKPLEVDIRKTFERTEDLTAATRELTDAQKRLADAGKILTQTSADEERALARQEERMRRLLPLMAEFERMNEEELGRRVGQRTAHAEGGLSAPGVDTTTVTQQTDEMVRAFEHAQDAIQGTFADTFTTIFEGGVTSAEDFALELKSIFTRLAGEIAALMIIRPALAGGALSGATGAAAGAGTAAPGLAQQLGLGTAAGGAGGFLGAPSGASLGGLILAGGLGAAGGSTIGGFFGGQGGTGGAVGGGLGAVAGTALFGPIGGVVGGLGGSILGGLVGGMFGGGGGENTGALRFSSLAGLGGPVDISGENAFAGPLRKLISDFDRGVMEFLNEREEAIANAGIQALGKFEGRFPEADPSEGFREILQQRASVVLEAAGLRPGKVLAGAGGTEDIGRRVGEALQTQQQIRDLTSGFGDFTVTARALAEQFAELRDRAKEYGISLEGVGAAQRDASRDLIQQRIAQLGGGPANTFARQLQQLKDDFSDLRQGARELGLSTEDISAAGKRAVVALKEQRAARLEEIRNQTRLIAGSLSWRQEMALLSQQFHATRVETSRLGGDVDKLRSIQQQAVERLKEQRKAQAELERTQRISAIQSIKDRAQSLTGIDPTFRQQIEAVNKQFVDLRSQMRALGGGLDGLTSAGKRAIATLKEQQQAQLDALALSVVEPFKRLAEPLRAFQDELRISMLNPAQQVADAADNFRRLAAEAERGSTIALEQLVGAGQRFIEEQGRFGASPAIAAATTEVQNVLDRVLVNVNRAQADASRGLEAVIERASRREVDKLSEVVSEARNIVAEIRRISR